MCERTDEEILLEAYHKMAEDFQNSKKKRKSVALKDDQNLAKGILSKLCMILISLEEMDSHTMTEIQSHIRKAKSILVQVNQIKARNPQAISSIFDIRMKQLMKAMSRHEAKMIENIRLQEPGGKRIDVEEVFSKKQYYNRLGNTLAPVIVRDAVKDVATSVGMANAKVYITETGLKYHMKDCPYCRKRNLMETTKAMAENQKLTSCKCVISQKATDEVDHTFVTAFIDESIRPVKWNEDGNKGNAGSFSYILCWGHLDSEIEITERNIIVKGIDYTHEHTKIERISEAAIGKVMITLAYDYNYEGDVHIYTDNMVAMKNWTSIQQNSKLSKLFNSVTVSYISREFNKEADKIVRQNVFLCIPATTYSEVVNKCVGYDNMLKKQAQAKAEEEARNLADQEVGTERASVTPLRSLKGCRLLPAN